MDLDVKVRAYKFVAYSAISFSLVAVIAVSITLPLMYNYVRHVNNQLTSEFNLCQVISLFCIQIFLFIKKYI